MITIKDSLRVMAIGSERHPLEQRTWTADLEGRRSSLMVRELDHMDQAAFTRACLDKREIDLLIELPSSSDLVLQYTLTLHGTDPVKAADALRQALAALESIPGCAP
jgi:hypothetical protein